MCGIAGVLFFDRPGAGEARAVAASMLRAVAHRGPDGSGLWELDGPDSPVALAHARLAIIDLSDAGAQPMTRGPLTVTFNGEIYNYRQVRSALERDGMSFRTQSDTEVLLAAIDAWGPRALERLEGMFAFAAWDADSQTLLLARDRLGVKPLYFHVGPRGVVFASEVRALLASGLVPRRLDTASLWHYLGYQSAPTPATLVENVRMLEPGHLLRIDRAGRIDKRRYWDLMEAIAARAAPALDSHVRERVRALLVDAVRSHLVSDVPVGVFLSGGIDSGALVSLVRAAGTVPQTFTVAFDDDRYDESGLARRVAARFGADHVELRLSGPALLDMLPDALRAVDHPSGDGVNSYVVSRMVRERGLKVALSGLGGDEVFGGYPSFRRLPRLMPAVRQWRRSPEPMRRAAAGLVRAVGGRSIAAAKVAAVMEGDGTLASVWPVTRQLFSERDRRALIQSTWWPEAGERDRYRPLLQEAYDRVPDAGVWAHVSYAESRAYMHDVLLRDTDQMSMAHALEVRVPLLDHRLVEYVVGLPARQKAHGGRPKSLLADSLPDPLPADMLNLPKRGFTLPFDLWMRGPMRAFCEEQLGQRGLAARGLFQTGQVAALWQSFVDGAPGVTWSRIWTLVALNAWLDRHQIEASAP